MLSPEQKEFFKDSVIRDENGNLMPLYHGSNSKFTVFDSSKGGKSNKTAKVGHWFTPSKDAAEKWAGQAWWGDNEPSVYETYLNIKKPMVYEPIDNSAPIKKLEVQLKQAEDRLNSTYRGSQEYYDAYREYNNIANEIDNLSYTDPYEQFRSHIYAMEGKTPSQANVDGVGMAMNDEDAAVQKYVDMLKSEGYDGIIIKGTGYDQKVMGGPNDQYVVFDSNQIKSVSNKKPTSNPDINYALAGLLGTGGLAAALAAATPKDDKKKKSEVK
jgi:C-terminal processing protease CtpA/Prc